MGPKGWTVVSKTSKVVSISSKSVPPDTQKSAFGSIQNCDTRFKADVLIELLEFPVYLILDPGLLSALAGIYISTMTVKVTNILETDLFRTCPYI